MGLEVEVELLEVGEEAWRGDWVRMAYMLFR